MSDFTPYQQKVVKRYYDNKETIQRQRLGCQLIVRRVRPLLIHHPQQDGCLRWGVIPLVDVQLIELGLEP